MAMNIEQWLASMQDLALEDEDGNALRVRINSSVPEDELEQYESRLGLSIPLELRQLFMCSNGLDLFGCQIMKANEITCFASHGLIAFHNWMNGDFDCVATQTSKYPEGTVLFMNHSPDVLVQIESSLLQWMSGVVDEIREKGALWHPADYIGTPGRGIYSDVLQRLQGIDCELNRR